MLHLWNEGSLSELDKYLHADEDAVRAGALLGMGVMCTGAYGPGVASRPARGLRVAAGGAGT